MKYFLLFLGLLLTLPLEAKLAPLAELKAQAERGDLTARVALAHRRFDSIGDTREENEHALNCYRKASKRGDYDTLFEYAYGLFLHPDLAKEGEDWRRIMAEAARLGSIRAADILAWSYYKPTTPGIEPDYAKAEELLLTTLDQPKRGRYHTLGLIYVNGGYGVAKNPERAFKLLGRYADEIPYVYRILGKILTDWKPLQGKEAFKIRAYACYLRYQKMVPEPTEGLFEERTNPLNLSAAQIAEAQKLADDGYPTKPEHFLWTADDGPYSPDQLAADALAFYNEKGEPAMRFLLDERFTEFHLARPRHPKLFAGNTRRYFRFFKEAQTGAGRNNPAFAAALYQWLFDNCDQYPVSFNRFNIMNNLVIALSQSGQKARAKVLLNETAEILALSGYDTNLESHPRRRYFRIFPKVNVPNYRNVPLFRLDHAAFLTMLAEQALVEGRWQDALAQGQAHIDVVGHTLKNDPAASQKNQEWRNQMVAARNSVAEAFDLLQFHDRADQRHRFNAGDRFSLSYGARSQLTSKVSLFKNQIRRHELEDDTIERLRKIIDRISKHKLLTRHDLLEAQTTLILALFESGKTEEGWAMLHQLRSENPDHLPFHLIWVEEKIAVSELNGLEDILITHLRRVRSQGEKVAEVRLYLRYAQLLTALDRFDEAVEVQREAIRLLDSFDLYTWLPLAHLDLAQIHARAGNLAGAKSQRDKADTFLNANRELPDQVMRETFRRLAKDLPINNEDKPEDTPIDLQPSQQLSVPLQGFVARGLFTLKNPSSKLATGQFQVTGKHLQLSRSESDQTLLVTIDPSGKTSKTSPLNLSLEPGEQAFVDLSTTSTEVTQPGNLTLRWLPAKGAPLESSWTYEPPADDGVQSAVIDAGLFIENPFFNVPIYHLVQRTSGFEQPVDLKIIASQQARIEVYDENNQLVFVDANGDGDLLDSGDLLVIDQNSDGTGDLNVTRQGARSSRFFVQVSPAAKLSKEGLTLSYQNRDEAGRWQETSRDSILPRED